MTAQLAVVKDNESQAIQPQCAAVPQLGAGLDLRQIGQVLAKSGYFKDVRDEAQAITKVIYGAELGIQPVSAMMGIHIIEGKPSLSANLIATLVKRSGKYTYIVQRWDAEGCELMFLENGQQVGPASFVKADAAAAGLLGKNVWKSYPKAMYFARAVTMGARTYCADVFGGAPIYTPEELGVEVDGEGNAIGAPSSANASIADSHGQAAHRADAHRQAPQQAPLVAVQEPAGEPMTEDQRNRIMQLATDLFGAQRGVEMNKILKKPLDQHGERETADLIVTLEERLHKAQGAQSNGWDGGRAHARELAKDYKPDASALQSTPDEPTARTGKNEIAARVFAAMGAMGLPDEPRDVRMAAVNAWLEASNFATITSFNDLGNSAASALATAIRLGKLAWDASGEFQIVPTQHDESQQSQTGGAS